MTRYCSSATQPFTATAISIMSNPRSKASLVGRDAFYFSPLPYTIATLTPLLPGPGSGLWVTPSNPRTKQMFHRKPSKRPTQFLSAEATPSDCSRLLKISISLNPFAGKVNSGAPYIGSSAGSNVAGPTIKTTKDMPIVQPRSFDSLGLVPFQISPHYLDPDPSSTHMGETQEERILQFLEENNTPVVGIREGAWLLCTNGVVTLKGQMGARIFRRGHAPVEVAPGTEISNLIEAHNAN